MDVEMVSMGIKGYPRRQTKNYPHLHTMMWSISLYMVVMVDTGGMIMLVVPPVMMPMVVPVTGICEWRDAEV
jgi:hypothetical protein